MPAIDAIALRVFVYDEVLARGKPPSLSSIASHFAVSPSDAGGALANLKIGKTILVDPTSGEIWMAGPFAAMESPYRVVGDRQSWWANCAWDMIGVAMIANEPVNIESRCTECGEPMTIRCDPTAPPTSEAVVHFLVPARRWYDDIGFT